MDTPISRRMRQLNGVAHIQDLLEAGFTRHQVAAMKNGGELIRPRIGWYVSPEISPEVVRAVRVGGMLGCCSAIASYGLPAPTDRRLHVALDPGASRLRSSKNPTAHPPAGSERGVLLHWRDRHVPHERFRVGLVDALHQMSVCAPFEWTVAAIDAARLRSAGAPPLLDEVSLQRLRRVCSESGRRAADLSIDSSESVLETMVRLRLADSGVDLRVQVPIGKYRADIVLDGWLVIECDGEHHSTVTRFASDRERDAYFTTAGYRVLRFSYRQIVDRWYEEVLPAILAALKSRASDAPRRSAAH